MLDLDRIRHDTRGVATVNHLNNAGASLMPAPVADAVVGYLREEERYGGYETARARRDDLEDVYDALAALLSVGPSELAITDNATRAWDLAFYGLRFGSGDRILTTTTEYAANYIAYLQIARRTGAIVDVVPDTATGEIDVDALDAMIDDRVKVVSMNHMPTNSGLLNPVAAVGAVTRRHGVPFLLDACQTVGQVPIDVDEIGCDLLTGTSRKFLRGPRGVGFLYVRSSMLDRLEPPMLDLHGATWVAADRYEVRPDARRFELWERNLAGEVGLAVAVRYALDVGVQAIWGRVRHLAERLRWALAEVPGVTVTDIGAERGAIVTFTVAGMAPAAVRDVLAADRINVSVSSRAAARLDMERRHLEAVVRASPHYFNTEAEVDALVAAVDRLAGGVTYG